jgi:hypothetical protein
MNDSSESSIEYADVPYVSYEYPARYRRRIRSGRRFIYYRGRRRAGGGRQPQAYLGTGIVGDIRESEAAGRLICEILDGEEFPEPLPFKDEDGIHLEPGGSRSGYFQQGVREIPEVVFQRILNLGESVSQENGSGRRIEAVSAEPGVVSEESASYASPEVARETERQSRKVVAEFLARSIPGIEVREMATNNPGFDLETSAPHCRFVEVKGTNKRLPAFFLSEGERRFGVEHPDAYLLVVVYGMDLALETYEGIELSRAPLEPDQVLKPAQWVGRLPASKSSDPYDHPALDPA